MSLVAFDDGTGHLGSFEDAPFLTPADEHHQEAAPGFYGHGRVVVDGQPLARTDNEQLNTRLTPQSGERNQPGAKRRRVFFTRRERRPRIDVKKKKSSERAKEAFLSKYFPV